MRHFTVQHVTARRSLVLTGDGKPVDKPITLTLNGKPVAKAVDTIGRVDQPFYIALPLTSNPDALAGKTLLAKG